MGFGARDRRRAFDRGHLHIAQRERRRASLPEPDEHVAPGVRVDRGQAKERPEAKDGHAPGLERMAVRRLGDVDDDAGHLVRAEQGVDRLRAARGALGHHLLPGVAVGGIERAVGDREQARVERLRRAGGSERDVEGEGPAVPFAAREVYVFRRDGVVRAGDVEPDPRDARERPQGRGRYRLGRGRSGEDDRRDDEHHERGDLDHPSVSSNVWASARAAVAREAASASGSSRAGPEASDRT